MKPIALSLGLILLTIGAFPGESPTTTSVENHIKLGIGADAMLCLIVPLVSIGVNAHIRPSPRLLIHTSLMTLIYQWDSLEPPLSIGQISATLLWKLNRSTKWELLFGGGGTAFVSSSGLSVMPAVQLKTVREWLKPNGFGTRLQFSFNVVGFSFEEGFLPVLTLGVHYAIFWKL